MHVKLLEFKKSLSLILDTIDKVDIPGDSFQQQYGWNLPAISKTDIENLIINFMNDLTTYDIEELPENYDETIDEYVSKITAMNSQLNSYFTNNGAHLISTVPCLLLTLNTFFSDIRSELFSWDVVFGWDEIKDKKMVPRTLTTRLRGLKNTIDGLDVNSKDLKQKIELINDAHESAESLPTDLATLRDAKSQTTRINTEVNDLKNEITRLKEKAEESLDDVKRAQALVFNYERRSKKLVDECDDALQITTTQGLAAGFDLKAKQLNHSIWVWIGMLLIALGLGAYLGFERVKDLTDALSKELSPGQAILHTIMSVFSIGGPLWLAWISTQQITQRFKLAEDYAYKATVAKSYTGFSKHAGRFDDETAERLFNSTLDRFDEMPLRLVEGKDYNSPWHEFLDSESFKKALDLVPELANTAGKFASSTKLKVKPKSNPVVKPTAVKNSVEQDKDLDSSSVA